jgi:hypothetical protein
VATASPRNVDVVGDDLLIGKLSVELQRCTHAAVKSNAVHGNRLQMSD